MRISRVAGKNRPDWGAQQRVGCEIEIEGVTNPDFTYCFTNMWSVVPDGSLRNNGQELISPAIPVDNLVQAMPHVYDDIHRSRAGGSVRTGLHLHFDMLDSSIEETQAVCAVYSIVEPLLYAQLPPDRDQGIYCIPWYRSPSEARVLAGLNEYARKNGHAGVRNLLGQRACKYSGLNILSLATHGTLEFRMAPTFRTWKEAVEWVELIASVVATGKQFRNAEQVLRHITENGVNALLPDKRLPELAKRYDSYYCAELLAGGVKSTWYSPAMEFEARQPPEPIINRSPIFEEDLLHGDDGDGGLTIRVDPPEPGRVTHAFAIDDMLRFERTGTITGRISDDVTRITRTPPRPKPRRAGHTRTVAGDDLAAAEARAAARRLREAETMRQWTRAQPADWGMDTNIIGQPTNQRGT
jgi:hypothetical protein